MLNSFVSGQDLEWSLPSFTEGLGLYIIQKCQFWSRSIKNKYWSIERYYSIVLSSGEELLKA